MTLYSTKHLLGLVDACPCKLHFAQIMTLRHSDMNAPQMIKNNIFKMSWWHDGNIHEVPFSLLF